VIFLKKDINWVLWFLNSLKQINYHYFLGVPRQLAGRVFRFNLFFGKNQKKGFSLQPLTQINLN